MHINHYYAVLGFPRHKIPKLHWKQNAQHCWQVLPNLSIWAKSPKHQHPWTLTFGLTRDARDDVALSFGSLGRRNLDWSIPSTWITRRSLMLSHASSWSVQQMHLSAYWSDKCLRYSKTVASFCSKLAAFPIASLKWKQSSHWLNPTCSYSMDFVRGIFDLWI